MRSEGTGSDAVLLVDDDRRVRALYAQALSSAGLDVFEAGTGVEALQLLEIHRVATVVLDSRMPGLKGLEVVAAIRGRASTRSTPIILISASDDPAERVACLEAGANDFLVKPIDLEELVARVRLQLREQAKWLHVVEANLRDRYSVVNALSQVNAEGTAEATAAAICRELGRLPDASCVALIAFAGGEVALPLAAHGPLASRVGVGSSLPVAVARDLYERALAGPWIQRRSRHGRGLATDLDLPGPTAFAPLRNGTELAGVLMLSVTPDPTVRSQGAAEQSLSAAIDFGSVAAAILSPSLASLNQREVRRRTLRDMLDRGDFHPVFQPIVELRNERPVGFEALTRFGDGTPPDVMLAEAHSLGLGLDAELCLLEAALMAGRQIPGDAWLAVNVSPHLALEHRMLAPVLSAANRPIVVELTEHDRVSDYARLRSSLDHLGGDVRVSIDDAGAGYASLGHVLALSPAFIKLDRGWVHGIDVDQARQALVVGLNFFAQETGCKVIAEGIETESELLTLRRLGVWLGQGYLIGRPAKLPTPELHVATPR